MPTELGPPYPINYPGLPTHMSTEDYTLWVRYQTTIPQTARALYFDVKLGGHRAIAQNPPPNLAHMWYSANAKRADVLIAYDDHVSIVELRTRAQPNAIGRLQTYRMLWEDDPAIPGPLTLELITDTYDPDIERLSKEVAITYRVLL